ncbi:hypothetical protein TIFTF001_039715 [Ficus carica]|uniref:Uncharacterized protein n=1 Tax=Ficus carica TaxID=3494 RepID=A0AA88CUR2_FICCA|nr:hypothetical protein TIFTF001_039714 [Ficus carica]GMN19071.1 hypothetical protein TIFTF001_039715 [Ficus carica]
MSSNSASHFFELGCEFWLGEEAASRELSGSGRPMSGADTGMRGGFSLGKGGELTEGRWSVRQWTARVAVEGHVALSD